MTVRGPRPDALPRPAEPGAPRAAPSSPEQRLVDFGMARTPAEAVAVLREILTLLAAAGFPVPRTAGPEQQLSTALRQLQKDAGLPVTGRLDDATAALLRERGLVPSTKGDKAGPPTADRGRAGVEGTPDRRDGAATSSSLAETRFTLGGPRLDRAGGGDALRDVAHGPRDGAASTRDPSSSPVDVRRAHNVETEQTRARVDASRPDVELDLKGMLDALRTAGFAGAGRGREQLQDAVRKLQRVDGLPVTGRLDAATAAALQRRGVLDAATARALAEQDPAHRAPPAPTTSNMTSTTTSTTGDPRTAVPTTTSAETTTQGTVAPRSDDAVGRGANDDARGGGAGRGVDGGDGHGHDLAGSGVVDDGDVGGTSDGVGRDVAGDDVDGQQGNANVDGDDVVGEHWQAPSLALQIEQALLGIRRDDDGRGAATYRWAIVLVRPGVYTSGQPAEELLRLSVERAGPFDPAWAKAIGALNERLRRHEPDAAPLTDDDVRAALQRARYRGG
jgi:hypothetical protein